MKRATPARRLNRHLWVLDELRQLPTCVIKPMFGAQACYFNGLLVLVLSDKAEPWRGLLVPCERAHHAAITREFPALSPHPILPKWLYLPESAPRFEQDAKRIASCIRSLDTRFGVVPPARHGRPPAAGPGTGRARFGRPIP